MTTGTRADRLLSPNEVADALHVSRRTVDRMIRDGRIPAIKLGEKNSSVRIDPVELLAWIHRFLRVASDRSPVRP